MTSTSKRNYTEEDPNNQYGREYYKNHNRACGLDDPTHHKIHKLLGPPDNHLQLPIPEFLGPQVFYGLFLPSDGFEQV
jgi:hypothetical protein